MRGLTSIILMILLDNKWQMGFKRARTEARRLNARFLWSFMEEAMPFGPG
jgi:hypothetical protein